MRVKFLGRGSGSPGAAAEYLLEERNAAGEEREEVEVLQGDPWRVAEVADSLEFEYRYTSGVIAWAPEDEPSEDEIEQTLEEFERTAWAGLEEERYALLFFTLFPERIPGFFLQQTWRVFQVDSLLQERKDQ